MATDIAFALGILALLGRRVPPVLKVFLTALAVIDDLGAIITIAVFYSNGVSAAYLGAGLAVFALLAVISYRGVTNIIPYVLGGILMCNFMLHSGVHATISGVMLAFVVPKGRKDSYFSMAAIEAFLEVPVTFVILPLFSLANTAIVLHGSIWQHVVTSPNSLGIFYGLVVGKPLGILLFSFTAVSVGLCVKPDTLKWRHIAGAGLLGGIGFTMSIFITLFAFDEPTVVDASKVSIIAASLVASTCGLIALTLSLPPRRVGEKAEENG